MKTRAAIAIFLLAAVLIGPQASATSSARYTTGGTVVVKQQGQSPDLDQGFVRCDLEGGNNIGGACLSFAPNIDPNFPDNDGAILVNDDGFKQLIAFQVCVDNNGDYLCTSGGDPTSDPCADFVAFSHSDRGDFFNPLGPLPTSRVNQAACNPSGGGWNGYVVFICQGVHSGFSSYGEPEQHAHPSTNGTIKSAKGGGFGVGLGDFCGGTRELVVEKPYLT